MKLSDVSTFFDLIPVTHPTTGALLFHGQVDGYDDSRRDSATAYRRILSVQPGTVMPSPPVVRLMGQNWLVGAMEPDGWAELHREKYVIQQAPLAAALSSLTGFLAGIVASMVHCAPYWVKDAKQLEVSAETPPLYEVALSKDADVRVHDVIWGSGFAYLVLSPRLMASGIFLALTLRLDQSVPLVASLTSRVYDPVSGDYNSPAAASVNALRVRWQSLYQYGSQMAERYQEGDVTLVLPAGTSVTTQTSVALSGVTYQVLSVLDISGAVVLHARVT